MRTRPTLFAAVWLIALVGFVVMAAFAAAHDTFPRDVWMTEQLREVDSPVFADVLDATERLARLEYIIPITLVAAAGFAYRVGIGPATLLVATAGARVLNYLIKEAVGRPRPMEYVEEFASQPHDPSFPSGHAHNAMLFYGLLFYLAAVYLPDARIRLPLQALCIWAIVGNGLQRVYVGYHWPSDVLGGYYVGLLVLAVLIAVDRVARRTFGRNQWAEGSLSERAP